MPSRQPEMLRRDLAGFPGSAASVVVALAEQSAINRVVTCVRQIGTRTHTNQEYQLHWPTSAGDVDAKRPRSVLAKKNTLGVLVLTYHLCTFRDWFDIQDKLSKMLRTMRNYCRKCPKERVCYFGFKKETHLSLYCIGIDNGIRIGIGRAVTPTFAHLVHHCDRVQMESNDNTALWKPVKQLNSGISSEMLLFLMTC